METGCKVCAKQKGGSASRAGAFPGPIAPVLVRGCGYRSADRSWRAQHARPDKRKPPSSAIRKLRELLLDNPQAKSKGLSVGRVKIGSGAVVRIDPVRSIDDSLITLERLSYYRLKFLKECGIKPSEAHPISDIFGLFIISENIMIKCNKINPDKWVGSRPDII
ncbi:hypothetical protein V8E36_002905 [Tilletia maclaganii]